jgi:hypothetical protein
MVITHPYRTCTLRCRTRGWLERAADLYYPNLTEACLLLHEQGSSSMTHTGPGACLPAFELGRICGDTGFRGFGRNCKSRL